MWIECREGEIEGAVVKQRESGAPRGARARTRDAARTRQVHPPVRSPANRTSSNVYAFLTCLRVRGGRGGVRRSPTQAQSTKHSPRSSDT